MDPAEVELSGPPAVRFRDPESTVPLVVQPRELAREYVATVRLDMASWRKAWRRQRIGYNPGSAGGVVDGGLVLDRLRVAALLAVGRTTSAERVWLMLCDGVLRGGSREALRATIDSTHTGWQRLDLVQAVDRAARMVNAQPLSGREVHLFSDLQSTALSSSHADVPRGVRVLALAPGRAIANRGIAGVTVSEGAAVIDLSGSLAGNRGTPQPVPVTIRLGGGGRQRRGATCPAVAAPPSARAG